MAQLARHAMHLVARRFRQGGLADALESLYGVARALPQRRMLERLFEQTAYRHIMADPQGDPLVHISHRHFLATGLSLQQRCACALTHFSYESAHYGDGYLACVYGGGGIELWRRDIDGVAYTLQLCSPLPLRHEGPLSVVLRVDDLWLHETSFAWVDAELFAQPGIGGPIILVARNQSSRFDSPRLRSFRSAFPQNSPSYFCLAAVQGIAKLHGLNWMAGIKHRCQIAFEEHLAEGFQRSYCDVWRMLGGVDAGRFAFLVPVPPRLPDLSEINPHHRARARERRENWAIAARSARETLAPHLKQAHAAPAPASSH